MGIKIESARGVCVCLDSTREADTMESTLVWAHFWRKCVKNGESTENSGCSRNDPPLLLESHRPGLERHGFPSFSRGLHQVRGFLPLTATEISKKKLKIQMFGTRNCGSRCRRFRSLSLYHSSLFLVLVNSFLFLFSSGRLLPRPCA